MKKFATLTVAALTAATAFGGIASAQPANTGDFARAALERIAPTANVSSLSNAQAVAVYQVVSDENPATQKAQTIALINAYAR